MDPITHYTKSGDVHIAYQVVGDGPRDLVYLPGIFAHIELQWEEPSYARFLQRLASFSRLIVLDTRGTGLSDRSARLPLLEHQMDDVTAVLDAVASDHAVVFGVSQSGPMAALYAATKPHRTEALVLYGAYASAAAKPGYPWGRSPTWMEDFHNSLDMNWGAGAFLMDVAPSRANDKAFCHWWGRFERYSSAPGNALAFAQTHSQDDVRNVLQTVSAPTLVLQRKEDSYRNVEHGRYLAGHIPGAKYVEVPGSDHLPYIGDQEAILDEIEEFLTGVRPMPKPQRVLATIMFTDIVGSTQHAHKLGDKDWKILLERHDRVCENCVKKFRGKLIKRTGDGIHATFDGPGRAISCAREILDGAQNLGIGIRAGLHTGECEIRGQETEGVAVHLAARVAALANSNEVLVSRTVRDLVAGSGLEFTDRGIHKMRGFPEEWQDYSVV
ncbi:adenylate/guanylate cyclase domain-containing protein [Gammaproteobacteria bacterium]|nr:adenylate/guanylate cyclase domain-containing protein [Gammaproteobacteria bacterium]